MTSNLIIGTRGSQLALWQANWVKSEIEKNFPGTSVSLEIIKTKGDKILDVPLAKVGGKGLFVKEIEDALLEKRVDLAVHSMKDMPAEIPEGLCIAAIPERENPLDVLISRNGLKIDELPEGAKIGTSSLRRMSQIAAIRPDLQILSLRGNLDTRIKKLEAGEFDAIILAAAGVRRLGLSEKISQYIDPQIMLPASGQGALCIETRENDPKTAEIVRSLNHETTASAVIAERAFLHRLEGGCQVPIAAHAKVNGDSIEMEGLVSDVKGTIIFKSALTGKTDEAAEIGRKLAEILLEKGAKKILDEIYSEK